MTPTIAPAALVVGSGSAVALLTVARLLATPPRFGLVAITGSAIEVDAPAVTVAIVQVNVFAADVQPAGTGRVVSATIPDGRGSVTTTPDASDGPLLMTVRK